MSATRRDRVHKEKLKHSRNKSRMRKEMAKGAALDSIKRGLNNSVSDTSFSTPPPSVAPHLDRPFRGGGHPGLNYKAGKGTDWFGNMAERVIRNYTTDVGDAVSRTIQDTFLGGTGKSDIRDYPNHSLITPKTGNSMLDTFIKYQPANLLAGNMLNNSDFSQMLAPGDIIPVQKGASLGAKGLKLAPEALALAKYSKVGLSGVRMVFPRSDQRILGTSVSFGRAGFRSKDIFKMAGGAPKPNEKAVALSEQILADAVSKAGGATTHRGVVEASDRSFISAFPGSRLSQELGGLWRQAGETTGFPKGATDDVYDILSARTQSPAFGELLDARAKAALPDRGQVLRTQGVLVPYTDGQVDDVPLADILDYLHLGARAGKAATGMPTSRITGSGLLRVGVEEAPSRVARYNSTAAREVTGVREVSEAISGGVPSLASEPRRAVDEVAGVFAPRDELFREGVAPTVIDLVDPTDYTDGLKHYNIDRIDPKTHAGILEGIANALTDGNLSDNDRQFFTTLFDEILSPENSILTGGAFNQSKSDFTTTRAIHNALITARRKLQEKSGSVYIPKTIEEMTAYTDTSTLAGKKYSKLFSDTYTPVLGRALGSLDAFKGHDPKLIRETLEGVQKIRQKSRGAGMKKEEVQTFLQEVSGILRADKKEADKLREIQLLRDKYLRKVSADQFVMHIDY